VLSLSAWVEAEPAPAGLRLALPGQGAEVVARVQDPAGELVGCTQRDGGDEAGGGLRVSRSAVAPKPGSQARHCSPQASCPVIGVRTKPGCMPSTLDGSEFAVDRDKPAAASG
jgi:hypothetical protein